MFQPAEIRQIIVKSKEFNSELVSELKHNRVKVLKETARLAFLDDDRFEPAWADCVWSNIQVLEIDSITDAQSKLRKISKRWRYLGDTLNRRGALIAEKLSRPNKMEAVSFPLIITDSQLPVFTLADKDVILWSDQVLRPSIDGKIAFNENKTTPPSRAYLKLWEALTLLEEWPRKEEHVIDLGSSPGSWTWVLSELGAQVTSIDRAVLDSKVMTRKNVHFEKGDAFSFQPRPMDWVFSDVICFPDKLFGYIEKWLASGFCKRFVCNVKFAGKPDIKWIERFRELPNSRLVHLLNAKNELTWICHPKLCNFRPSSSL